MKFPKHIKYRGRTFATIYGKSGSYPSYRVAWSIHGKRRMKAFDRYDGDAGALEFANKLCKDIAKGSQSAALTATQATDALAAFDRLQQFFQSTGRRVSLLAAVSEFTEATAKLNGHSLREAVDGYLRHSAAIRRCLIADAVEEFIAAEQPRTVAKEGQRSQLAPKYANARALLLRRIAKTFPNTAVSDLTREHLDALFSTKPLIEFSPKSRNHHRGAIRQLLRWCVRKDYLSPANRLTEADSMRPEHALTGDVQFYTANDLRALLDAADEPMRAMIAIGALAGLRTAELLRLDWEDVWRVRGHIEITSGKSKTRQRRLVEVCPSLAAWLEPFRKSKGRVWVGDPGLTSKRNENLFHKRFTALCKSVGIPRRDNGLRHSFVSFHHAVFSNENLTAAQAGNTPRLVHSNYRGLATKAEGEAWFSVQPATAANIIQMERA